MAYGDTFEIIERLRDRLGDHDAEMFTNDELIRHIEVAVAQYSRYRPYMKTTTVATVLDQQLYNLPTDCLWVERVWVTNADSETTDELDDILLDIREHSYEYDDHQWREQLRARLALTGQPVAVQWNNQLKLYPKSTATGDTINVEYGALHTADASGNYATIRGDGVEHLTSLVIVRCLEALATDAAKRVNYADGQARVDGAQMSRAFRREADAERFKVLSALSENCVGVG